MNRLSKTGAANVLRLGALLALGACSEQPLLPTVDTAVSDHAEIGLPRSPSFASLVDPLANCTTVANVAAVTAPFPICVVERNQTQTRVRITFEGAVHRQSPGTIGYATFPSWHVLVARRVGAQYDGNTYNEPSGFTTLFWSRLTGIANTLPTSRDILLARPVHEAQLYFSARTGCVGFFCNTPRLSGITLKGLAAGPTQLASDFAVENYNQGSTPNSAWTYNKWTPLTVASPTISGGPADNRIGLLNINGYEDLIGIDDLYLTIINFRPVSVITGGPQTVPQGTPLTFNGGVSFDPVDAAGLPHPQSDAVSYLWDFGDGAGTATSASPTYTYLKKGEFTAKLTVTDPNGMSHFSTVPVTVTNVAPTVTASAGSTATVGEPLVIPASFTDPGLDAPWAYSINWGDGTVKSGTVGATGSLPEADRTHSYTRRDDFDVTIQVTDANGSAGTAGPVKVTVGNRAPTAAFGAAPTYGTEGSTLSFNGAGSADPDGDALTYTWSLAEVGSSTVQTFTGSSFTYSFPEDGQFTLNLTVGDGSLSSAISTEITIANVAPTATALAPASGTVGSPLTLSVRDANDPSPGDLATLQYAYDCGSGYSAPTSSTSFSCTPSSAGPLTVRVRVTDPDGASSDYSSTVTVVPANTAPVARMEISGSAIEGSSLNFNGLDSSDPDGHSLSYVWTVAARLAPGKVTTFATAVGSVLFPQDGVYDVTLTVFDSGPAGGLSNTIGRTVTIQNASPVVALAGGSGAIEDASLQFAASVSDAGVADGPWSWTITWGDGSSSSGTVTEPGNVAVGHVYSNPGQYTAVVTVGDKDGATGTSQLSVAVARANRAPTAALSVAGTPLEGSSLTFNGGASNDPDNDALDYLWSLWSDATPAQVFSYSGSQVSHQFTDDGAYTVRLTVREKNSGGLTHTASRSLSIANVAPVITGLTASGSALHGGSVSLSGSFVDAGTADANWSYVIDWGNGTSSSGTSASIGAITAAKVYPAAGNYTIRLTVADKDGGVSTRTATTSVIAPVTIRIEPETIKLQSNGDGTISVFVTSSIGVDHRLLSAGNLYLTDDPTASSGVPVSKKQNGSFASNINPAHAQFDFSRTAMINSGNLDQSTTRLYLKGSGPGGILIQGVDVVRVVK